MLSRALDRTAPRDDRKPSVLRHVGSLLTGRRRTFPTVNARGDSGEWFDRTPILVQKDLDGAALERRSVISLPPAFTKRALVGRLKKARKAALDRHSCRTTLASHTRRASSGRPCRSDYPGAVSAAWFGLPLHGCASFFAPCPVWNLALGRWRLVCQCISTDLYYNTRRPPATPRAPPLMATTLHHRRRTTPSSPPALAARRPRP